MGQEITPCRALVVEQFLIVRSIMPFNSRLGTRYHLSTEKLGSSLIRIAQWVTPSGYLRTVWLGRDTQ